MDIIWHGQSNYVIKTGSATIVIDPFGREFVKLPQPKLAADVLLISHGHDDHNNVTGVSGDPYLIDMPGEYESNGVMIEGIPSWHDDKQGAERGANTIFSLTVEGIHVVHCGDLGHKLDDATLERLGNVDILMIPVGGHFTIDAKTAIDIMKKVQPRVTIPMHYLVPGLGLEVLAPLEPFIKEAGQPPTRLEKTTWKIKKSELPTEESQIIVFPDPQ